MLEKFERYPLTFGPTHIEKLERLGAHLGGKVELYAKREDCNSGLAFGGNKLRKLEYIIPDAIASNADTLVSIGGVQSNHTRMVAAVAAKIGRTANDLLATGTYDRVVSTGASVAVSFMVPARARRITCHYVERAARPDGPSLPGKVVSRLPGLNTHSHYPAWAGGRWHHCLGDCVLAYDHATLWRCG